MNALNNTEVHQSLCKNIRALRRKNGWTQTYIAQLMGICTSGFSKIESGVVNPNLSRLEEIAHSYKVSFAELFVDELSNKHPKSSELDALRKKLASMETEIKELSSKLIELHEILQFYNVVITDKV